MRASKIVEAQAGGNLHSLLPVTSFRLLRPFLIKNIRINKITQHILTELN
jgi:hypothetical protein